MAETLTTPPPIYRKNMERHMKLISEELDSRLWWGESTYKCNNNITDGQETKKNSNRSFFMN